MYVYVWEHMVCLSYRTNRWIFTKLSRDEVLMVPYKCFCFSARSVQGRIQGGAKIGHGGPLLQRTSSSDRKATATNQMHSDDLQCTSMWNEVLLFLVPFQSQIFDAFLTSYWT